MTHTPGAVGLFINSGVTPSTPFTDPKTGVITPIWWRFLISLLARTGGATGLLTSDAQLMAAYALVNPDGEPDNWALVAAFREIGTDVANDMADQVISALALAPDADYAPPDQFPVGFDDVTPADDISLGALLALDDAPPAALADGFDWSFRATAAVLADTYVLTGYAPFAGAFTAMKAVVGPTAVGSLTETLTINGMAVTGINAVTVNSATVQTFTATGANSFIAGDKIALVIAIAGGIPVGAWSTALYTRV